MIAQLRRSVQHLERPAALEETHGVVPTGLAALDAALGGGLARGALHEIAAASEAHIGAAAGFSLGLVASGSRLVWVAEEMALAESGLPYGPGLDTFGLAPERLLTVAAANQRDLLWTMEEALRCRAVGVVIGELRHDEIDGVAVRRLSLAAGQGGGLALLLRTSPPRDTSTAATRWIVSAACNDAFAVRLTRNRRGALGAWTLQWRSEDARFVPATHAQPVAAPAADRPHRQVA